MNKARTLNYLIFALVAIMCLVCINTVDFMPKAEGSSNETEITDPIEKDDDVPEIDIDDPAQTVGALYKKGDSAKAWQTAYDRFKTASGYKSVITGTMSYYAVGGIVNVNQNVYTSRVRYTNGDQLSTTKTTGTKTSNGETYYDLNRGMVFDHCDDKVVTDTLSNWVSVRGIGPNGFNYVINESTIAKETSFKQRVNGNFEFTIQLVTNGKATEAYAKYINYCGKSILGSTMPIFNYNKITFTVNSKGDFVKIVAEDDYYFNASVGEITGSSKITETFTAFRPYPVSKPSWLQK